MEPAKKSDKSLTLTPVSEDNLELAVETAVAIFDERDRDAIEKEFGASAGCAADRSAAQAELHIINPHYFLATVGGQPVGVTGYYNIEGHEEEAWLGWMGVLPEHRRGGIGPELVRQGFAQAAQDNPRMLRIWTTLEPDYEAARRLYARL